MCPSLPDENGFIKSYEDAFNLIKETYPDTLEISEGCHMTNWQAAKKIYHCLTFGIELDKYSGFDETDRLKLQQAKGRFIPYVRCGGKLPPIELVHDFQSNVRDFCTNPTTDKNVDAKHFSKIETPCIMFFNNETRQIVAFNKTSGDLITLEKYKRGAYAQTVENGIFGCPKK